jgi:hypothetical protein
MPRSARRPAGRCLRCACERTCASLRPSWSLSQAWRRESGGRRWFGVVNVYVLQDQVDLLEDLVGVGPKLGAVFPQESGVCLEIVCRDTIHALILPRRASHQNTRLDIRASDGPVPFALPDRTQPQRKMKGPSRAKSRVPGPSAATCGHRGPSTG